MSTPKIEVRSFGQKIEFRKLEEKGFIGTLSGYAVVYDTQSRDMGGWVEIIAKNAMRESLAKGLDVRFLYQHKTDQIMAREGGKTLTLTEDDKGVRFESKLVDTQLNRDAFLNVEQGNLDAMSFGMPYGSVVARWASGGQGKPDIRTVTKADIVEISLVTWAAYEDTTVAARDYELFRKAQPPAGDIATPVNVLRSRLESERYRY
jgi:HK97 family phage prohead protease